MYAPTPLTAESDRTRINPLLATDKLGRCALHYAASEGHGDVITWIMEQAGKEFSGHPQVRFNQSAIIETWSIPTNLDSFE